MVRSARGLLPGLWWLGGALIVASLLVLVASSTKPAEAAKGGTCASFVAYNSADRVVSADDQAFRPETERTIQPRAFMLVRGRYADFDVRLSKFEVLNYTLTSPLTGGRRAEIFARKTPQFAGALAGPLTIRVVREHVRLERGTGQSLKIQAKDCQQGGIFQHEPEPGLVYTHVLGAGFRYNGPPGEGSLCFTNDVFPGYDSPELATRLTPPNGQGTTSTWRVESGGRMGMVVGEDAVENGCTA